MKQQTIKSTPKGEYIRLTSGENAPVWIRGEYCPQEKKFELSRFDDKNHVLYRKGDKMVYTGFTF